MIVDFSELHDRFIAFWKEEGKAPNTSNVERKRRKFHALF